MVKKTNGTKSLMNTGAFKRVFGVLVVLLIACLVFAMPVSATPEEWDGNKITPVTAQNGIFEITNGSELAWIADQVNKNNYNFTGETVRLVDDINLNSKNWTPIGLNPDSVNGYKFAGTFDGNYKTISNLNVTLPNGYTSAGLFGTTKGVIKNFTVDGATIYHNVTTSNGVSNNGIAVVVGSTYTVSTTPSVENIIVKNAIVIGNEHVGGIVGYNNGNIKNCSIENVVLKAIPLTGTSDVSSDNGGQVGGIAGHSSKYHSDNADITDCTVKSSEITGAHTVGGIAGVMTATGTKLEGEKTSVSDVEITVDQKTYQTSSDMNGGSLVGWNLDTTNSAVTVNVADVVKDVTVTEIANTGAKTETVVSDTGTTTVTETDATGTVTKVETTDSTGNVISLTASLVPGQSQTGVTWTGDATNGYGLTITKAGTYNINTEFAIAGQIKIEADGAVIINGNDKQITIKDTGSYRGSVLIVNSAGVVTLDSLNMSSEECSAGLGEEGIIRFKTQTKLTNSNIDFSQHVDKHNTAIAAIRVDADNSEIAGNTIHAGQYAGYGNHNHVILIMGADNVQVKQNTINMGTSKKNSGEPLPSTAIRIMDVGTTGTVITGNTITAPTASGDNTRYNGVHLTALDLSGNGISHTISDNTFSLEKNDNHTAITVQFSSSTPDNMQFELNVEDNKVPNGAGNGLKYVSPATPLTNTIVLTGTIKNNDFSKVTNPEVGKDSIPLTDNTVRDAPVVPQQSSSSSSGSSVWLQEPVTPTETPTEQPTTPTDTVPTDIPSTQPTATPASPGFGILAVLAGLGAVAVLRRQ